MARLLLEKRGTREATHARAGRFGTKDGNGPQLLVPRTRAASSTSPAQCGPDMLPGRTTGANAQLFVAWKTKTLA